MPNEKPQIEFEYDLFVAYATDDSYWFLGLADRLRDQGVRVWRPGSPTGRGDVIRRSRKMAAIWSPSYFREKNLIALAERFKRDRAEASPQDRLFIPLLLSDSEISMTFENLPVIDFRNTSDFDLRVRQLVEALDLPARKPVERHDLEIKERATDAAERGRRAHAKGKQFESEVATLYGLLGCTVKRDLRIAGTQIDLAIERKWGGMLTQAVVECKDKQVTADERDQILAQKLALQREMPKHRCICVTSRGFAADTRTALDAAGVDCVTYFELLAELVPLGSYVDWLIRDYEENTLALWKRQDWFIRPDIQTDVMYEKQTALAHFAKWLGDDRRNFLAVLGDLGTGKSTLARFLAYDMARGFRDDPLRHRPHPDPAWGSKKAGFLRRNRRGSFLQPRARRDQLPAIHASGPDEQGGYPF